ncbi:MAG: ABC transporter permease [Enterococcus casseliflavus]
MLVVKNLESNFYYKAIYTNYDWYLPLSEGRNFVKEDFYDGKNRAIVGKELASKNKNNVNIEGKKLREVIGVLDGSYSKKFKQNGFN